VPWTIAFLVSVGVSMALLEFASRSIPMGTAYAVWGGIGAVGTVIVGLAFFGEPSSLIRVLLILVIVAAIAGLKLFG
jgi:quaternary ammonium compound-resistance protein SugE